MSDMGETDFDGEQTIEAIVKSLLKVLDVIERDGTSLEEAMRAFERGISLTRKAQKALSEAEQRVQVLQGESEDVSLQQYKYDADC